MTARLLLHVGHLKTASTWLQNHVFDNPDLGFLTPSPEIRGHLVSSFVVCNPFTFNPDLTREHFTKSLPRGSDKRVAVLSDECLLGDPMQRRYDGHAVAQRLHACFGTGTRILICIREQKAMALSMYREYIKQGFVHNMRMFLGTGREDLSMTPILRPDHLEYHHAIRFYMDLFGRENICVLPFERLREGAQAFLDPLLDHAGLPRVEYNPPPAANVGASALALAIRRPLNRLMVKDPLSGQPGRIARGLARLSQAVDLVTPSAFKRRAERHLRDTVSRVYGKRFAASNQETRRLTGLDLEPLGYDMGR